MLGLVGPVPDQEVIAGWSGPARAVVYDWAIREHLIAADNEDVEHRPRPAGLLSGR